MTRNPIYEAIQELIAQGRLTGVTAALALDGESFVIPGDDAVDPEAGKWREDGTSVEASEWGGRQIKGVEEARKTLPPEQAARLPQWFVRIDQDTPDSLTEKQEYTARQNYTERAFFRLALGLPARTITTMYEYGPRFVDKTTGEPVWSFTPDLRTVRQVRTRPGTGIPNHRIAVGEWTNDQIVEWARNFGEGTWDN